MRKNLKILPLATLIAAGALVLPAKYVTAGGGPGDPSSRQHSGTHFFGEVKDIAGFKPLAGARVKVAVAGTRMFLVVLTDADGQFRLEGFGRDIPGKNIQVTCEKDGYRVVEQNHRQMGREARSPIGVECLLARKNPNSRRPTGG